MRWIWIVVVACAAGANAGEADVTERVDAYVTEKLEAYGIPGAAVAVVRDGAIEKLSAYGTASVPFDVPVGTETVFQLFSVTKIWTGTAVMLLAESGDLSLHDPVTDHVPELGERWKAVRIRHLLSHTSGFPEWNRHPRVAEMSEKEKAGMTDLDRILLSADQAPRFPAGERFAYHRSGYNLVGLIVARVSGMPFADFLRDRIFEPLEMTATGFGDSYAVVKHRPSMNYTREDGRLVNWLYAFGFGNPGAGLNASIEDVARFLVAIQGDALLPAEARDRMWAPTTLKDGRSFGYGLGWTVDDHEGRRVVGHEGGGAVWVAHFPDDGLSLAVLSNLNGSRADEIQHGIASFYLEE